MRWNCIQCGAELEAGPDDVFFWEDNDPRDSSSGYAVRCPVDGCGVQRAATDLPFSVINAAHKRRRL